MSSRDDRTRGGVEDPRVRKDGLGGRALKLLLDSEGHGTVLGPSPEAELAQAAKELEEGGLATIQGGSLLITEAGRVETMKWTPATFTGGATEAVARMLHKAGFAPVVRWRRKDDQATHETNEAIHIVLEELTRREVVP